MSEDPERARGAGMAAFLAKSFTFEQLDRTLRDCCVSKQDEVGSTKMDASGGPVMLDLDGEIDWREVLDATIVDQLLMLEEGSPGFFAQVVETYLSTSDENLQELLAAVRAGELQTAKHRAHALVGSSRQVGAAQLGELCAKIERADSISALEAHLAELPAALRLAQRALTAAVQHS